MKDESDIRGSRRANARCNLARTLALAAFTLGLGFTASAGTTYYVDPLNGNMGNDGRSPGSAWRTLQEVADMRYFRTVIDSGDTLILMTGLHGDVVVKDISYDQPVVIKAANGAFPVIERFKGDNLRYFTLDGLIATKSLGSGYWADTSRGLISFWSSCSDITVTNCRVFSVPDSSGWGEQEWLDLPSNGINMRGSNLTITNNYVWNVKYGILFGSRNVVVRGNWVNNFVADGFRAAGDDLLIEANLITNNYGVGSVHSDALQFYQPNEVPDRRVTIRGNIIMDTTDHTRPFIGHLQGIASFDEPAIDWVIENNFVIADTTHGISLHFSATGCQVLNNTVYGFYDDRFSGTPIRVHGSGNVVRNNLTTSLGADEGSNDVDHNMIITASNASDIFEAPEAFGFRLKTGSIAIDQGTNNGAPQVDFEGDVRPKGASTDVGAEEAN